MLERSKKARPKDANERAYYIMLESVGEGKPIEIDVTKNPHAVALGKLGGLRGGAARAAALTPEKRSAIAKKAAAKRWGKSG